MKFISIILPVLLAVTVGVAGCDRMSGKTDAGQANTAAFDATIKPQDVSAAKLVLYSQAYKLMMTGQTGLKPTFDGFVVRLKNARVNDDIFLTSPGRLEYALELFRQGYAMGGGNMPELDKNVLDVINAISGLMAQKDEIGPLLENQDGNEIRGQASYSSLRAGYEALFTAMDRLEPLLFKYRKIESEKRMAWFKKSANPLGFYTERSLANAQDLLALFIVSNSAINDSSTYDRGDLILSSLEESLSEQRKAYANAKSTDAEPVENYPAVYRILTSMIGSYRDLRQNRTLSDLSALNKKYNEAIQAHNRVFMLSR